MIIRKKCGKKSKQNRQKASWGCIFRKIVFWIVLLGFFGVAIWTLLFSDEMKIEVIEVDSVRAQKQEVERVVRGELAKKHLQVIPKDNLLMIPRKKIAQALQQSFIYVKGVKITKKFPKKIIVKVQERESHIIWCSRDKCMLVDEFSEPFYEVSQQEITEGENLVKVVDLSGKEVEIGSKVADSEFILFCEGLPNVLQENLNIEVEKELKTPSSMSQEVRARTTAGWELLFSTTRPAEVQVEILKKILNESIEQQEQNRIEYIDLRLKGRATYKFKDEESKKEQESDDEQIEKVEE